MRARSGEGSVAWGSNQVAMTIHIRLSWQGTYVLHGNIQRAIHLSFSVLVSDSSTSSTVQNARLEGSAVMHFVRYR